MLLLHEVPLSMTDTSPQQGTSFYMKSLLTWQIHHHSMDALSTRYPFWDDRYRSSVEGSLYKKPLLGWETQTPLFGMIFPQKYSFRMTDIPSGWHALGGWNTDIWIVGRCIHMLHINIYITLYSLSLSSVAINVHIISLYHCWVI